MTEGDMQLLKRIEEQAVEISDLRRENERLRVANAALPKDTRRYLLQHMSRASVNCGRNCGCYLAARMLEDATHE